MRSAFDSYDGRATALSASDEPLKMETPYWRIDAGGRTTSQPDLLLGRLARIAAPTLRLLRSAAPTAAVVVIGAQLLSGLTTVASLLLTTEALRNLLADGSTAERLTRALPALLQIAGIYAVRLISDLVALSAKAHLVPKVQRAAEEQLYVASLDAELSSFDDPGFYDQLLRARDRGVMHIESAIDSMVEAAGATFTVVGAATALTLLNPLLFLILFVALLPEGWAALTAARLKYAGMAKTIVLARQVQMMAELATRRESAPEVRANQARNYVLREYRRHALDLQDHMVALGLREARVTSLGRVSSAVGVAITFVALGFMLEAQWLGAAVAGTAVIAIRSAGAEITRLMRAVNDILEKALYVADYHEFVGALATGAAPTAARSATAAPATRPSPDRIELRDVHFRYPGSNAGFALTAVSLRIEPGQSIALVGENGSGKTTLAKVIAGLYTATSGDVLWDGVDIRSIRPQCLSDDVTMVLQEPIRWPRTARDNIRLGRFDRTDPDDAQLHKAAMQSLAMDVIDRLPSRWNTLLSKEFSGGQDLSSGQWQRLAVARGLFRGGKLVIWDEPTAPLDAKAERAVYESLRDLARERTVILITHRLASVRNADLILFLDRGRIAESGTHEQLLQLNGKYAELYRIQTQLHATEEPT